MRHHATALNRINGPDLHPFRLGLWVKAGSRDMVTCGIQKGGTSRTLILQRPKDNRFHRLQDVFRPQFHRQRPTFNAYLKLAL
jgi:hypothetical protein